jgi:hypothetical protein
MNKQEKSNELYHVLAAVFSTKKQVVQVNDKYAARYKKWWQKEWTYIGINSVWSKRGLHQNFVLEESKEAAYKKLKRWFPEVVVLNGC